MGFEDFFEGGGRVDFTGTNTNIDPLLGALQATSLLGLGQSGAIQSVLEQNSPIHQIAQRILNLPDASPEKKQAAIAVLFERVSGVDSPNHNVQNLRELGQLVGLDTSGGWLDQLKQQQQQYTSQAKQFLDRIGASKIDENTFAARERAAKLAAGGSNGLFDDILAGRTADLDRFSTEARDLAKRQAQAGGYNPAGILGDIEAERLRQQRTNYSTSLEDAIALQTGELNAIIDFLNSGTNTALGTAGITSNNANNAANIAAQQAIAANNERAQRGSPFGRVLSGVNNTLGTVENVIGTGAEIGGMFTGIPGLDGGGAPGTSPLGNFSYGQDPSTGFDFDKFLRG